MIVAQLFTIFPSGTRVRVQVSGKVTYTFTTGPAKGRDAYERARDDGNLNALVYAIYPLYHAQEVYCEAVHVDADD